MAKTRMDYQAARDAMGYYDLDDGSPKCVLGAHGDL